MRLTATPRTTALRAAALVASAAMVVVGVQTGSASASGDRDSGGLPLTLSASQRTAAIQEAQSGASATAAKIGLSGKEKLIARDVVKDADGTVHTRYERTYDGLPVLGGDLIVHEAKAGRSVTKANDATIALPSTDASLAPAAAKKSALSAAADQKTAKADGQAPRKVVWAAQGKPVLAYETVVTGVQKDGTPSELHVITDAASGKKLYQYEAIETGTGTSTYSGTVPLTTTKSGSQYQLNDGARGGHKTYDLNQGTSGTGSLFTNSTDTWGGGRQTAGVDAHYGAAVTWDFYKNVFGRNGIRNDGKAAYSRVHYGNSYVNAFWSDSCFCMTYGDGQNNKNPLTALDVAAHEMSHGVTAATAKLVYSGESGGLNEATSDIFGTAVEFYANNKTDVGDYLIGEKINIYGDGKPLRYMDKPSKDGKSKDSWYSGIGGVDVHYSSGPANHFFYLLSEGSGKKTINGVDYDSPTADGSKVTGIGRDKAQKIWYKALTTQFTSNTNYAKARTGTLNAAASLYGNNSAEYKAVAAAWSAINVK
ncbi:M4 family metallopeptidase [Streptomyces mobaraensis]|uniref:Neutral metalloproteinase n=3 Tax=Streptomyces mobaraensis TaxID=35621 RepID=N1NTP9_STRMB|nr:peptidase M4 thermolysin [Streptomyces mobaraensis NBRC 13819 = DSM 40847]KAB7834025.1 M4 family metallopeptidase [Streptomyces mobaraensis]CCW72536.1 metalloprotease 2 [Streptomyces mobaraensis NBRC 13819 = DSM 40847]